MASNNFVIYGFKMAVELIWNIIFFPLWWYTAGFMVMINGLINFVSNREKGLGFLVWLKNIHKPMYGLTDWQGKLISFFMRLLNVILRGILLLFFIVLAFIFALVWIALPPFVLFQIVFQIA